MKTREQNVVSLFMVLVLLICMLTVNSVSLAKSESRYEEPTPFGIAHREDGSTIGVYKKIGNTNASASLSDYTLCSILSSSTLSGETWFQVSYFDSSMTEQKGYVKGNEFYQLTVAGLISVAADPNIASYLQQFAGVATSASLISTPSPKKSITVASTTTKTSPSSKVSTSSERTVTYVLNKNTKKFHYPSCSSVKDIKQKNRQDFYGARNEIPAGYVPCKKCNP